MNDSHTTAVIMESLTRILDNARFASSPQMSAFLRYVVDEAVAGNADRIKAYSVAVDALGKPESFDAQKDPCVRVLAMRLRESLADYYQENDEPVVISIPRGSYKPRFVFAEQKVISLSGAEEVENDTSGQTAQVTGSSSMQTVATDQISLSAGKAAGVAAGAASSDRDQQQAETRHGPVGSGPQSPFLARFSSAQRMRWTAAFAALILGIWVVQSGHDETSAELLDSASIDTQPHDPQLAAAEQSTASGISRNSPRKRPNLPTVHILGNGDSDELLRQTGIAVSGVLAKFNNLIVIRDHSEISNEDVWLEDYKLKSNAVTIDGVTRVNAELKHAATGAIAYTAAFEIDQQNGGGFTPRVFETIEAFAAQLARYDGPLISDYRQREGIRPELACLYELQSHPERNNDSDDHANQLHDHGTEASLEDSDVCGVIPWQLDNTRLTSIMLSINLEFDAAEHSTTPEERDVLLQNAIMHAEQAVSLGPYQAETHAMLMQALHLTGNLEQAMVHGARAMQLNPFDSEFLRRYARLLSECNKKERATEVEAMADKLDSLG